MPRLAKFCFLLLLSSCSTIGPLPNDNDGDFVPPQSVVDLLLKDQQYELAEQKLLEQVSRQPRSVSARVNLALLYTETERVQHGTELLQSIVERQPKVCEAQVRLGQLYRQQFEFDKAETAYQTCLKYQPTYPGALLNLGILLELYRGDLSGALTLYRQYQQTERAGQQVDGWIADISRRLARQQQIAEVRK